MPCEITLMSEPFCLIHSLRPRAQCHEVALDNMFGVCHIKPNRQRPR